MTLKSEDAALFYELFLPLLNYVNHHYYVTEDIDFTGKRVDAAKAMEVARFLWEQPSIIDDYINDNIFPLDQMDILSNWKHCIPGRFIIERHLKKGSVFISTKDERVYLVNGIIASWEDMLFGVPTPIIVDAVLLPFKDCIITDGLVSVIPVRFGGNYTRSFKEIYMTAKRNGSIIKSI